MEAAFAELAERLRDNYPFFHPRYAGQMLKPPHPAAVAGQLAAMLVNPNNHALDGGPATAKMEREVVARLAAMFGYGDEHLGHLTTSGTIANLEALFVARELHPERGVAFSAESHYTHGRMCGVLGVDGHTVPVDARGRMDLDALDALLAGGQVGTVVATAGTTGLGAIDPVHEILEVAGRHGVRVHVDAAYGGFFALLAGTARDRARAVGGDRARRLVVVDPHKHGLQPYGCGAILFRDPVGGALLPARLAVHVLHLRRAPPRRDQPRVLARRGGRRRAVADLRGVPARGARRGPRGGPPRRPALGRAAGRLRGARALPAARAGHRQLPAGGAHRSRRSTPPPRACSRAGWRRTCSSAPCGSRPSAFAQRHPAVEADADGARILRSVLMKPEHEAYVGELHAAVEALA